MIKLFIKLIIIIGIVAALYFVVTGGNFEDWLRGRATGSTPPSSGQATSTIGTDIRNLLRKLGL